VLPKRKSRLVIEKSRPLIRKSRLFIFLPTAQFFCCQISEQFPVYRNPKKIPTFSPLFPKKIFLKNDAEIKFFARFFGILTPKSNIFRIFVRQSCKVKTFTYFPIIKKYP